MRHHPSRSEDRDLRHHDRDLEKLAQWLKEQGIRQVAMESTSVYWLPVFNVLEEELNPEELMVGRSSGATRTPSCWPGWRGAA